eukprot:SAG31_NODE_8089_length_1524_cov_2.932632_3_plen_63_part_00
MPTAASEDELIRSIGSGPRKRAQDEQTEQYETLQQRVGRLEAAERQLGRMTEELIGESFSRW